MTGHGGHGRWSMLACCVPMVVVAVALVVAGVVSAGFLLWVGACVTLMFVMMRGMSGPGSGESEHAQERVR